MDDSIFSIDMARELLESSEQFPVDLEKAWQWLGYSKKGNCMATLTNNFVKDVDFRVLLERETNSDGTFSHNYHQTNLTVRCFKKLAMMAGTEKGDQVRDYFIYCEETLIKIYLQKKPAIDAVDLANAIQNDIARLERLSPLHLAVLKQQLLGNVPQLINPEFLKQQDTVSLINNRAGLTFNKCLKAFDTLQDIYSPESYKKLKDLYQQLATEHNNLLERCSAQGVSIDPAKLKDIKDRHELLGEQVAKLNKQAIWLKAEIDGLETLYKMRVMLLEQDNTRLREEVKVLTAIINDSDDKPNPSNKRKPLTLGK